jgi:hypothetical protein
MTKRAVFLAYLTAPLGSFAPLAILVLIGLARDSGPRTAAMELGSTARFAAIALMVSYASGLLLLPVLWLFEVLRWRGWRYYVPTSAVAGLAVSLAMAYPRPFASPWTYYVLFAASGASCAVIFSIVLLRASGE